ncbi:uncharacterized protein PV07_12505 [Cladophialophora immunda]|uniref:NADP-dependent oxidoreductase domain-containing protein n=1 Tax=Cladophialophora immunda TaxID=569365 RepID=A0A0D2BSS1_9EURO|nr:uncharacterized protein PV07_12505 [Cladophialophora immunda]KIW22088.1 hypothetical protein PV07_12505 [Cladophialophora immunda]
MAAQTADTLPKMPYVRLGNSGLKVSRLILGCASYGTKSDVAWRIEEAEALTHLKESITNLYPCEEILGKFVQTVPRESVVIMTKGNNRKHIFDNVKAALKRLQTDYIDVLQLHRFDYETPIEETMRALHDVVQAGYVRYIGMSSCWAWQFHAMQIYALNNGLTPFVNCQNFYNLLYREEEREMMPLLKYLGAGSTPWSPMAKGHLTRPLSRTYETVRSTSDLYHDEAITNEEWEKEINRRVEKLSIRRGLSMAQVALAWVLHKDCVCAPIVGITKLERFDEIVKTLEVKLDDDEIKFLEEPYHARHSVGFI